MGKRILYILFALAFLFVACSKNAGPQQNVTISAVVNGKPWAAKTANVTLSRTNTLEINILVDSGSTNINLYIGNYIGKGIYPIANIGNVPDSPNRAYYTINGFNGTPVKHTATDGQIVVQNSYEFNGTQTGIQGYFNFDADTFSITGGKFSVLLTLN